MLKNWGIIIREIEYRINPMGVEIPVLESGGPVAIIEAVKSIPKVEKRAILKDLAKDEYKQALEDPIGFLQHKMKTDLLYLLREGLGFPDVNPKSKYCQELAQFYALPGIRKAIVVPRWHFKTTYAAGHVIQTLLNNPNKTWLIDSATSDNSKQILDLIKRRITSPNIELVFGNLQGENWAATSINVKNRTEWTREPNIGIAGIGTELTGQHPDDALLDDLTGQSNYETQEGRQKVKDYYEYLMFIITHSILYNATIWHYDDLTRHLLDRNAILPQDNSTKYKVFFRAIYDELGEPLFPEKYPREWIENKRLEMGHSKFACQMMNNPVDPENKMFRDADITGNLYEWTEKLKEAAKYWNYYITDDPASSDAKTADKTAIVVCGVTSNLDIYVVDFVNKRMDLNQHIDYLFALARKWSPQKTGVERGILEKMMKRPIRDREMFQNFFLNLKELKYGEQPGSRGKAKYYRIESLQPYVEAGMVHIRKDMTDLQRQMLEYPSCKYDDLVDALAYQLQLITRSPEFREKQGKTPLQNFLERKRKRNPGVDWETQFINEGVVR